MPLGRSDTDGDWIQRHPSVAFAGEGGHLDDVIQTTTAQWGIDGGVNSSVVVVTLS